MRMTQAEVDAYNARHKFGGMRTTPCDPIPTELPDACALGEEIKGLHEPFIQWCNLHQILYVHANPTKKSTVQKGQADFVLLHGGCGAVIEFKALADPQSGLSDDQKNWLDWAGMAEVPALVTNSLSEAIKFATRELEL